MAGNFGQSSSLSLSSSSSLILSRLSYVKNVTGKSKGLKQLWSQMAITPVPKLILPPNHHHQHGNSECDAIYSCSFNPCTYDIATAEESGNIRIFSDSGKPKLTIAAHKNICTDVDWLNDQSLISCSADESILLWNMVTGSLVRQFGGKHSETIKRVKRLAGSKDCFVSCSRDGSFIIWDTRESENRGGPLIVRNAHKLPERKGPKRAKFVSSIVKTSVTDIEPISCGLPLLLSTGVPDQRIKLWDLRMIRSTGGSQSRPSLLYSDCGSSFSSISSSPAEPNVFYGCAVKSRICKFNLNSSEPLENLAPMSSSYRTESYDIRIACNPFFPGIIASGSQSNRMGSGGSSLGSSLYVFDMTTDNNDRTHYRIFNSGKDDLDSCGCNSVTWHPAFGTTLAATFDDGSLAILESTDPESATKTYSENQFWELSMEHGKR